MKFKEQDFRGYHPGIVDAHKAAELANAKLEEWLHRAPTVYSPFVGTQERFMWANREILGIRSGPRAGDTHKAKLVCVERLEER